MFTAEFCRLSEDLFNLCIVALIPIGLGLHHKDWDVLVQSSIVFLKGSCNGLRVSCDSCILDRFGLLSEAIDMSISELLKLCVSLILG